MVGLTVEASCSSAPSLRIFTRGPSMPRMMGRLAPAPKWLALMPGMPSSVSPSVAARRCTSSSPSSTVTGVASSLLPSCRPLADTVTVASVGVSETETGAGTGVETVAGVAVEVLAAGVAGAGAEAGAAADGTLCAWARPRLVSSSPTASATGRRAKTAEDF